MEAKVLTDLESAIKKYQRGRSALSWSGFLAYAKIRNSDLVRWANMAETGEPVYIAIMDILINFKNHMESILEELLMLQSSHPWFKKHKVDTYKYNFRLIETLLKISKEQKLAYKINEDSTKSAADNNKLIILPNESEVKLLEYDTTESSGSV